MTGKEYRIFIELCNHSGFSESTLFHFVIRQTGKGVVGLHSSVTYPYSNTLNDNKHKDFLLKFQKEGYEIEYFDLSISEYTGQIMVIGGTIQKHYKVKVPQVVREYFKLARL